MKTGPMHRTVRIPEGDTSSDLVVSTSGLTRGFKWSRLLALGVLAVAAYQLGLHIFAFLIFPGQTWNDGLAVLSILFGLPVAFAYGVLVSATAWWWETDGRMLRRVLASAGWYLLGLAGILVLVVAIRLDINSAIVWLALLLLSSLCSFAFPFALPLYTGWAAWKFLMLLAVGVPTEGPILLFIWLARRRFGAASN